MRLIDAEKAVEELSVAYWDKGIQAAKDDPCIVDAMTDWAIRTIKAMPTMGDWIACSERLPFVKSLDLFKIQYSLRTL